MYWNNVLELCIVIMYWNDVCWNNILEWCVGIMYSNNVLYYIGMLCWNNVLEWCIGIMHWNNLEFSTCDLATQIARSRRGEHTLLSWQLTRNCVTSCCDVAHSGRENLHQFLPIVLWRHALSSSIIYDSVILWVEIKKIQKWVISSASTYPSY